MKWQTAALTILAFPIGILAANAEKCGPVSPGGKQTAACMSTQEPTPSVCANKTVQILAKSEKFESVKHFFMMFSNLPYEVTELKKIGTKSLIAISYRGEGPNSFVLADRVRSSLESKFSEYGIEKIEAMFDPKQNCK